MLIGDADLSFKGTPGRAGLFREASITRTSTHKKPPKVGGGFRELKLSLKGPVFRSLQPFVEDTQNCRNRP